MADANTKMIVAAMSQKNLGLGIFLTLFFGGLGMFYATILGGLVFLLLDLLLLVVAICTAGIGGILYIPLHILAVIFTIIAINSHNKKLLRQAEA